MKAAWIGIVAALSCAAAEKPRAVPTFESLGLYFDRAKAEAPCRVRYRAAGAAEWREGYPLVYDEREKQYRGSLVGLKPDTLYDIRLDTQEFQARTLSEAFPVGKTTHLPGGTTDKTLTIREGGSETGWHLVTPSPGARVVSDVFNLSDYNVVVEADYVILRGLELKNAAIHGVLIRRGVQHVAVEDCHITGWGRMGGARVWGVPGGSDSGIYADNDAGHLVIQRNLIEYPRGASNDWESGHPSGPQGISLIDSRGGNVIRYNTIRSTEDHGFNDGIGGASNFSFKGSPNRDSDIYGNIVANCWDDAIESEGANCNVRIWSNYLHHAYHHIATAATSMGPLYIFRNVFGESRISHQDPSGGAMIKTGGKDVEIDGRRVSTLLGYRFVFHNTGLQPNGGLDVFSGHELHNAVTRNNIFYVRGRAYPPDSGAPRNDFKNDLTGGYSGGGFVRSMFLPGAGMEWFLAPTMNKIQWGRIEYSVNGKSFAITDPLVQGKNPALDAGVPLPGFNDDYSGAAPDIGAFENGRPPLRFGREMAPGFARPPWEVQSSGLLRNGVYAILREAPDPVLARVEDTAHTVLLYNQKYTEADRNAPPRYVALATSSFVPLILAGPPDTRKDERGWTLLSVKLAKEHVSTLEAFTRAHLGGTVAVVLDGEIVTIHKVRTVIQGGQVQITRCLDNACEMLRARLAKD